MLTSNRYRKLEETQESISVRFPGRDSHTLGSCDQKQKASRAFDSCVLKSERNHAIKTYSKSHEPYQHSCIPYTYEAHHRPTKRVTARPTTVQIYKNSWPTCIFVFLKLLLGGFGEVWMEYKRPRCIHSFRFAIPTEANFGKIIFFRGNQAPF